jgi:EAL domain-containing protein (putative c-di-GMP-specific phosphodiesterase class I)
MDTAADNDFLTNAVVVIVDDNQANVTLLERILRREGVRRIYSTTDPREVLALYRDVDPDLVVLDLHMPHLDGFSLLSSFAEVIPDGTYLPLLVLTADATREAKERALAAGAQDFLIKPFDRTEVVLRTRNLLQTRALHLRLQRHNAALEAQLRAQAEQEACREAEHQQSVDRISRVLAGDELKMLFQPIADLATGEVVGVEALARFDCEPRRPPDKWFAEAAQIGLGIDLELAAVVAALRRLPDLPDGVDLSINASPQTTETPALAELLQGPLCRRVVLELTEHVRVDDYDNLLTALRLLRQRGVRLAVDDAGAGFAGLSHILRLRPDIIKLDIALTRGIDSDPIKRALALALSSFARELSATIIAEGIESAEELDTLTMLGIRWGQGYYLARPGTLPISPLSHGL